MQRALDYIALALGLGLSHEGYLDGLNLSILVQFRNFENSGQTDGPFENKKKHIGKVAATKTRD